MWNKATTLNSTAFKRLAWYRQGKSQWQVYFMHQVGCQENDKWDRLPPVGVCTALLKACTGNSSSSGTVPMAGAKQVCQDPETAASGMNGHCSGEAAHSTSKAPGPCSLARLSIPSAHDMAGAVRARTAQRCLGLSTCHIHVCSVNAPGT